MPAFPAAQQKALDAGTARKLPSQHKSSLDPDNGSPDPHPGSLSQEIEPMPSKGYRMTEEHKRKIAEGQRKRASGRGVRAFEAKNGTPPKDPIDQFADLINSLKGRVADARDEGFRAGWVAACDHIVDLTKRQALQPAKPKS